MPASRSEPRGPEALNALFGRIDIYVFDQLLRGRLTPEMRVLDAGCGGGRNSEYLMRCGSDVWGIDADPDQIARIRQVAAEAAPGLPSTNFTEGRLEELPYPDHHFDAVICSAVLHFSESEDSFEASMAEMWRVLRPGGLFFARLASTIGMEERVEHRNGRWFGLPDGSERFLVDADYLATIRKSLGGELLDPLKTTLVQDMRSMTTWVLGKP
ncbi:MAG: class I SAM-dependent methyltransferase [Longimicrobiales bacterium]|nr:class I SAM-dependent methyltransferase [Longimicrobiales bacterium]